MEACSMKIVTGLLFLLFGLLNCSSLTSLNKDPLYEKKVNFTKRITVYIGNQSNITKMEQNTLSDITRDLLSHHKEFIVYKSPPKFSGCSRDLNKIEGIFHVLLKQEQVQNDLKLELTGSFLQCPDAKSIWTATVKKSFNLNSSDNESLRSTYIQKYGMGIGNRVNPYFQIVNLLIEYLESPQLTDEEKDEKIEVESV
jgi:probable lipoprotein (TIGR04455 family)